jgi:uncharacterized membrane protein YbhN (UPF0104 family)
MAILAHYLIMLAFIPEATLLWMVFAISVAMIGVALPSSPGFVGVYEAVYVGALSVFGVSYESALAFALVDHVYYIGLTGIVGSYALFREGLSLSQVAERVQRERTGEKS